MSVSLTLSVLLLAVANANAASWKPSMCRPGKASVHGRSFYLPTHVYANLTPLASVNVGREEGDSVVLEASCLPEGMEVRWTSASSEVEWIQVEYQCRNLSTEDGQVLHVASSCLVSLLVCLFVCLYPPANIMT